MVPLEYWCIICKNGYIGANVLKNYEEYCCKRGFDHNVITRPNVKECDLNDTNYVLSIAKEYKSLMIVIPTRMDGSRLKARLTEAIEAKYNCYLRFIKETNAGNRDAVWGSLEELMAKIGNVMYRLEPLLPNGDKAIDYRKCWTLGINVNHNKGKPSAAMFCLQTHPLEGTHHGFYVRSHLNAPKPKKTENERPKRKDIIPFQVVATITYSLLEDAYEQKEQFPKQLFVFRDGLPDPLFKESFSKEVVGIQRGIHEFKTKHTDMNKLEIKLTFIIVSGSIIDRFGIKCSGNCGVEKCGKDSEDGGGFDVKPICDPCVIYNGITSERMWDFIIYPFHPKQKVDRCKPLRYIVLRDDSNLSDYLANSNVNGAWDLWQFIYTLLYSYAFSIPFPMGPTTQPGPIQYAKHYAQSFSQMIFQSDKKFKDLDIVSSLISRTRITTELIDLGEPLPVRHPKGKK